MLLVQFAMCNTHSHTHTSSVTFHVVFMHQLCGSSPECNHPSLHTHSLQLGPIEVISASGQLLKVHVRADIHLSGMYSQDVCPCFLSGQWKFNLAVQTTWIRKKMEVPCSKRQIHYMWQSCVEMEQCFVAYSIMLQCAKHCSTTLRAGLHTLC